MKIIQTARDLVLHRYLLQANYCSIIPGILNWKSRNLNVNKKMFCISPKLSDILGYLQPFKPAKVAKNCLQMINWHTFDTSVFSIEKKRLRGRNGIFFLVPFLQVHKKWCQLLDAALQHPKPVPAWLSRLKISCNNRY